MEDAYFFESHEAIKTKTRKEVVDFLLSYSKSMYPVDSSGQKFEVILN